MLKNIFAGRLGAFALMVLVSTVSWFFVAAAESKVDTFPGRLPITFKNVAEGLVPISDEETIEVRLRADQRSWSLLSIDSFTALVDLRGLGVGVHELPVTVAVGLPNVQVVEKNPATLTVRLEESVTKDLPVRVVVQGRAAEGRAPGEPVATPDRALVIGARSIVAALTDAQAVVTLSGEFNDVQRTVKLQAQGRDGQPLPSVTFEPGTVGIRIPIVQASNAKTVGVRVVTIGSPKDGFYVQKITVSPATVTLTGGEELSAIDTEPIDLTDLATNRTTSVDLVFPTATTSVDRITSVSVTLTVSAVPTSKKVPLTFTFTDLDPTLKVQNVDPAAGNVVLAGPSETLSGVAAATASVSLAGKGSGTHSVTITAEIVQPPPGTTVSGTPTPSAISVTLSPK